MTIGRILYVSSVIASLCCTAAPAHPRLAARQRLGMSSLGRPIATATAVTRATPPVFLAAAKGDGDYGSILRLDGGTAWQNVWSSPAEKGLVYGLSALAVSSDGAVLYVGRFSDDNVLRSHDGGYHWQTTRLGSTVRTLAVDPRSSDVVYAGIDDGLYKTTNGGRSWQARTRGLPKPFQVTGLALDRQHPTHLWIGGTSGDNPDDPTLYHSENGGATWTAVPFFSAPRTGWVNAIALSPATGRVIYVGCDAGLYRSRDGGKTWAALPLGVGLVRVLAVSDRAPSLVYVGVEPPLGNPGVASDAPPVYRSTNGGATWEPERGLPPGGTAQTLLADLTMPYAAYVDIQGQGLYRTADAGATWQPWGGGDLTPSIDVVGLVEVPSPHTATPPPASPIVLPPPTSTSLPALPTSTPTAAPPVPVKTTWMSVDPRDAARLYVGGSFDCPDPSGHYNLCSDWAIRSADRGRTWVDLRASLNIPRHPPNADAEDISISPALVASDGRHIYLPLGSDYPYGDAYSQTPNYLMSSTDGGAHWHNDGSPPDTGSAVAAYLSPPAPGLLYAVGYSALGPETSVSVLSASGWHSLTNPETQFGLCCEDVTIVPDPVHAKTIYANVIPSDPQYVQPEAAARSDDGGMTWTRVMTPTAAISSQTFAVSTDPHEPGLIVGTADDGRPPSVRRYVSGDGGRTWRVGNCPGGLPGVGCPSFTVDNVFGAGASYAFIDGGIYRFHHSGLAEARLALSAKLPADATNPVEVQAGTHLGDPIYLLANDLPGAGQGQLYRSTDAGKSWRQLLVGVPLTPNALLPTPADPAPPGYSP